MEPTESQNPEYEQYDESNENDNQINLVRQMEGDAQNPNYHILSTKRRKNNAKQDSKKDYLPTWYVMLLSN